jgi:amino acid adenylation domain-containing protein
VIRTEALVAGWRAEVELVIDSEGALANERTTPLEGLAPAGAPAYVIYTSGSTGQPKGVLVTHENVVRLFDTTNALFNFNRHDVWTLFHSYAFDFSVWELWGALLYGGRLVAVPYWISRSPQDFYRLLAAEKVTVLNQTPSAFSQLMQADSTIKNCDDLQLRLIIFGGEALKPHSLQPWFDRHGEQTQLVNMYGITETTVHVTYRPLSVADVADSRRSPIGRPLGDLQVYILDQNQELVPPGVAGEMYVGGAGVARGYLNCPDLTAERFVPHPFSAEPGARLYRTGDLARHLPNGDIEYLGRLDRQVKIRGFRVELGEIEAALTRHEAVRECVLVAQDNQSEQQSLVAYVVAGADAISGGELRALLKQKLPDHMIPSAFVYLDKLPLTANGKLDHRALPAPHHSHLSQSFVAPRSSAETMLAAIWSAVLKVDRVGIHDNFFELGGNSLLATQVISRVRDAFKLELPVRSLFETARLTDFSSLVERIEQGRQGDGPPKMVALSRDGEAGSGFEKQRKK